MPTLNSEYPRCQHSGPDEDYDCNWLVKYVIDDTGYCEHHAELVLQEPEGGCQYRLPDHTCNQGVRYAIADNCYCEHHAKSVLWQTEGGCQYHLVTDPSHLRLGYTCNRIVEYAIADKGFWLGPRGKDANET